MSLYMGQTKIPDVRIGGGGGPQTAVLYTEQNLEEPQREQARQNIGATDIGLGLTGMSVGDKIEVASIGPNGVPTSWKPEGKYELIEKYTAPETLQRFERFKEPDGTPYRFNAMLLKIKMASGEAPSFQVRYEFGSFADAKVLIIYGHYETSALYLVSKAEIDKGYWTATISEPAKNSFNYVEYRRNEGFENINTIPEERKLYYLGVPNEIPAGTEIEIWAVRV